MIKYEDIPSQYKLCLKNDCPMAETCLRHLAVASIPETRPAAYLLLPGRCTADADGNYPYYRSNAKVRYARGFTRVLVNFPVKVLEAFRDRLIGIYPRNKYFLMRRGGMRLSPNEQEFIIRTARSKGFQEEFTFDRYEEDYLWE